MTEPGDGLSTEEWDAQLKARIGALQTRGVIFQGVQERLMAAMLEQLLSPSVLDRVRREHFAWLEEQLTEAEAKVRELMLTQGLGYQPANGAAPNRAQRRHG